jgi:hypothetical protein
MHDSSVRQFERFRDAGMEILQAYADGHDTVGIARRVR